MKDNGSSLGESRNKLSATELEELFDDQHLTTTDDAPLSHKAFGITDDEKISIISSLYREVMSTLGLDLNDDSLNGTPRRVATMFVREIFSGLNPKNKPVIALFENKYKYDQMLIEKNITLYSTCEHHFVPIVGKAHIAYISSGKIIGLSKLNRLVKYYAQRPQVQERLTIQLANELKKILGTESVAVLIDAIHLCISSRGIQDTSSSTITAHYSGKFKHEETRKEFLALIK